LKWFENQDSVFLVLPYLHCVFPDVRRERREEKTKNGEEIDENALVSPVSSPFILPRLVFFFSPLRCLCVFSRVGGSGARIFKFHKAHFRRFLYICTTMSPLGDRFRPSKTTPE